MSTKAFSSFVSAASVGETSWMKNLDFVVGVVKRMIIIIIIITFIKSLTTNTIIIITAIITKSIY